MYNTLPCFVCARSIVFCQNFCQIMQWLPSYWTGEGDDFHGPLGQVLPLPFMCLPLSHPFFLEPKYFPALATQANTKQGYQIVSVINIHAQSMCCAQDGLNILGALISFPPSIVSASTRKTVWMIILHSLSQGLKTFYTE